MVSELLKRGASTSRGVSRITGTTPGKTAGGEAMGTYPCRVLIVLCAILTAAVFPVIGCGSRPPGGDDRKMVEESFAQEREAMVRTQMVL